MKNYANIEDFSYDIIEDLLERASYLKKNKINEILKNKIMVGLFFNPSTRTRTSFDIAMRQQGGHFISLEPGSKSWGIDIDENIIMDGENEEHLKEAVKVLARYADVIGLRAFPKFQNWDLDKKDLALQNMIKWSNVPIINMETISHPCQALAMLLTMKEKFTTLKKKKFVLSWSYHPKPLNTAVGNSALVAAAMAGMDVTVVNPPDYDLDIKYIDTAKNFLKQNNGSLTLSNNQDEAFKDADFCLCEKLGVIKAVWSF
jgi:N-acetylornithine carbamoyltransferase